MKNELNRLIKQVKKDKKLLLIPLVALIGVMLIVLSECKSTSGNESTLSYDADKITLNLETRIEKMCLEIDGVSDVHVMLTLDSTEENVYAEDISINSGEARYDYTKTTNGSTPLKYTVYPKVRGIAIVCKNGSNPRVKSDIINTVACVLGISRTKINVAEGG